VQIKVWRIHQTGKKVYVHTHAYRADRLSTCMNEQTEKQKMVEKTIATNEQVSDIEYVVCLWVVFTMCFFWGVLIMCINASYWIFKKKKLWKYPLLVETHLYFLWNIYIMYKTLCIKVYGICNHEMTVKKFNSWVTVWPELGFKLPIVLPQTNVFHLTAALDWTSDRFYCFCSCARVVLLHFITVIAPVICKKWKLMSANFYQTSFLLWDHDVHVHSVIGLCSVTSRVIRTWKQYF